MKKEELEARILLLEAKLKGFVLFPKALDLEKRVGELESELKHEGGVITDMLNKINELCEFLNQTCQTTKEGIRFPDIIKPLDVEPDHSEKKYLCMQCAKELSLPTYQSDDSKDETVFEHFMCPNCHNCVGFKKEKDGRISCHFCGKSFHNVFVEGYTSGIESIKTGSSGTSIDTIEEILGWAYENKLQCEKEYDGAKHCPIHVRYYGLLKKLQEMMSISITKMKFK